MSDYPEMTSMNPAPAPPTPPGDSASRSLSDALSTSFRILKMAMVVLVILFLASGTFVVEQNEQAIVLRLGKPVGEVREAGFNWAFPAPIDSVVKIPVRQSNTLAIDSHWMHLRENEQGVPLNQIRRGGEGLNPMRDGALLTADKGLVHIQWRLTYRIDDLKKFVSVVADHGGDKVEEMIQSLLENAATRVVGGYTTEEATRQRLSELRVEVKIAVNEALQELDTGIVVESVEIPNSTPPIQTILAFTNVTREENNKRTRIRAAEQMAREMLNETAGDAHVQLVSLLDESDLAGVSGDQAAVDRIQSDIDRIIEFEASGRVGSMIRNAKGFYTSAVQQMRADLEEYESLSDEFAHRPELLMRRLWDATKSRMLSNPRIVKVYRPAGTEVRLKVGMDPRQRQRKERDQYMKEIEDAQMPELEVKIPGGKLTVP